MTRVPNSVVEKRAKEYTERFNDPRQMCISSAVRDAMRTIGEITEWAEDFETFTHESFHLYPGWNQENFVLFVSLIPTAGQIEKQHKGVFCGNCGSRCNDVSPKAIEENGLKDGFFYAMEHLRHLIPLNEKMAGAVMSLEREGERRFGVDWNKE